LNFVVKAPFSCVLGNQLIQLLTNNITAVWQRSLYSVSSVFTNGLYWFY